jgi:hypothetical protein
MLTKKPYKDKRFSIAVFDHGEYSYRENKSTITESELKAFLGSHDINCYPANDERINYLLRESNALLGDREELKRALIDFYACSYEELHKVCMKYKNLIERLKD